MHTNMHKSKEEATNGKALVRVQIPCSLVYRENTLRHITGTQRDSQSDPDLWHIQS